MYLNIWHLKLLLYFEHLDTAWLEHNVLDT
jgi:hypothetical protein